MTFSPLISTILVVLLAATAIDALASPAPGGPRAAGRPGVGRYAVSDVRYRLDDANPRRVIDSVSFELIPPGSDQVRVRLSNAGGWYTCRTGAHRTVCATVDPLVAVTDADQLSVNATEARRADPG